jgi:hypothetical protein
VKVRPIQSIREYFEPDKKARVFERGCILSKKGAKGPILREICPRKMYPQKWRQYWRHNRNPVKRGPIVNGYLGRVFSENIVLFVSFSKREFLYT